MCPVPIWPGNEVIANVLVLLSVSGRCVGDGVLYLWTTSGVCVCVCVRVWG